MMDISPTERELLRGIRKRPCMYTGEYSLPRLRSFLDGYLGALALHGLDGSFCILPGEFHGFVTKRYGLPGPMGWCLAILENVPDGKEAVETFFSLLDEFLEANGLEPIESV